MNWSTVQRIIDEFHGTGRQQWLLRLGMILLPLGAVLAAAAANGQRWPAGLVIVPALALASAIRPDTQTALVVVVTVIWHWLATVGTVTTPWLPVAAVCLLAYHAAIALTASVPIGGELPRAVIEQWMYKTAIVAGATIGMWAAVAALDSREAPGNGTLTALALALVTVAAIAIRSRSLGTHTASSTRQPGQRD